MLENDRPGCPIPGQRLLPRTG